MYMYVCMFDNNNNNDYNYTSILCVCVSVCACVGPGAVVSAFYLRRRSVDGDANTSVNAMSFFSLFLFYFVLCALLKFNSTNNYYIIADTQYGTYPTGIKLFHAREKKRERQTHRERVRWRALSLSSVESNKLLQ